MEETDEDKEERIFADDVDEDKIGNFDELVAFKFDIVGNPVAAVPVPETGFPLVAFEFGVTNLILVLGSSFSLSIFLY